MLRVSRKKIREWEKIATSMGQRRKSWEIMKELSTLSPENLDKSPDLLIRLYTLNNGG